MNCKHPRVRGWTVEYDAVPRDRWVCINCSTEFVPMLSKEEQQHVIDQVKRMIRNDRVRRTNLSREQISDKSAREGEQRDWDELVDLLKEVG